MKFKIAIIGIIILAFALRFFQLGNNPPALTWDEVALGYNAYSLGIDGKDEFGNFLPLVSLESFGDYKPPVYAYLDIVPIKIFGLTSFAVRFPSAFLGVATVFLTYLLTRRIFYNSSRKELYALGGSLVLALSPWHIMMSRAAFEANIATFFIIGGVVLFLAAVQGKKWLLILSAIFFVLAMYSFNSSRIVVPVLVAVFACVWWRVLLKNKVQTIITIFIGIIMVLPLASFLLSPQAGIRFQEVNIFTDPSLISYSNQAIENDGGAIWSKFLHNHRVVYGLAFLKHYVDHFNPSFLFIRGDINPKFSTQDVGQLYLWDLPFLLIGLIFLFRKREGFWWIIPTWLLIGLLPAGVAKETPHALRTEAALPTFQILVGYGMITAIYMLSQIKSLKFRKIIIAGAISLLLFSVFYFLFGYFRHYSNQYSGLWQYGYEETINFVEENESTYPNIYDAGHLGRPYIYYLFYAKIDPREFRKTAIISRDRFGFVDVQSFGRYSFTRDMGNLVKDGSSLYIDDPKKVPGDGKVLKEIKTVGGNTTLVIYTY